MSTRSSAVRRFLATGVLAAALVLAGTGTAAAHVGVSAPGATAGTGPVTVTFSAASEAAAGIAGFRTQLPPGIPPASVTLASGPAGWALTPTADGYEVGGPPLAPGADAEYAITVAQLPFEVTELAFPTIQRYADGTEDAWIEQAAPGAPEPEQPAPVLTVAPGAPAPASAAPPAPTTAPETPAAAPTQAAPATTPAAEPGENGVSSGWIAGAVVLAVAALGAGLWFRSRSRAGQGGPPA
ncbi:DUF1775 domain-containing protein [Geodermatophilus sp. CPCC 206100]|uniref:DUF1775 domain-containing protein n=1 Tax=Geodermatophilus sp. CPCC 206100 TaxID=3020054 RepID=UPI003AFFE547